MTREANDGALRTLPKSGRSMLLGKPMVYLDNHATTAVDPRVLDCMLPYFTDHFGNASSSTHRFGWKAADGVDLAREQVATLIGCRSPSKEILFTSGATESNNLAIKGVARALKERGDHLVTVATEHKAVLDSCLSLRSEGFRVTVLPVDSEGRVDPQAVAEAIEDRTVLVSVMLCNNEVGTVQPIAEIGRITRSCGVLFHVDAVQGVGRVPFDVDAMNVDLVSLTAHKIYGPKGIGALYVRRYPKRTALASFLDGGSQEQRVRPGTLNVPGIVGLGSACELMRKDGVHDAYRVRVLRDKFFHRLSTALDGVHRNGPTTNNHPGNLNLSFDAIDAQSLLLSVQSTVAISTGSACSSADAKPSHVLTAMGLSSERCRGSIRFGLGRFNTESQMDRVANCIIREVQRLRDTSYESQLRSVNVDPATLDW
ncbi:MAG: cysteine desulfurase family protein [Myxococcota bacterium]